jgi:hypothetical protein
MIARAFALWEGWFGYDQKYTAMLREVLAVCTVHPKTPNVAGFIFRRGIETFPLLPLGASSLESLFLFVGYPPHLSTDLQSQLSS